MYTAADCTIPGIQAYRSSISEGQPFEVPDFRDPASRAAYRDDHFSQPRFDHKKGLFPEDQDHPLTEQFSRTMRDLIHTSTAYRAYRDWQQVAADLNEPARLADILDNLIEKTPQLIEVQEQARKIITAYPDSPGARVLREMLALTDEEVISSPGFAGDLKQERAKLKT